MSQLCNTPRGPSLLVHAGGLGSPPRPCLPGPSGPVQPRLQGGEARAQGLGEGPHALGAAQVRMQQQPPLRGQARRRRANLGWAEAITAVNQTPVSDQAYARARAQFDNAQRVALSYAAIAMNAWSRQTIAFGKPDPALAG